MNAFELELDGQPNQIDSVKDNNQTYSTNFETLAQLIKVAVGSGIFAFPFAYSQSGLLFGCILQLSILIFTFKSWCTLVDSIGKHDRITLIKYIERTYGNHSALKILSLTFTFLYNFGGGVSYLILFNQVLFSTIKSDQIFIKVLVFASLFAVQFGAQFIKNIKSLNIVIQASVFLMFFTILFLTTLAFTAENDWEPGPVDLKTVMIAFGIDLFAYDINGIITEIRSEMANVQDFKAILLGAMCIETLLYSSFGIICYLTFGEYTDQIVLLNFQSYYSASHVHTFLEIILVSYVSTLITTNFVINLPFYDFLGAQFQSVPLLIAGKSVYLLVQLLIAFLFPQFAIVISVFGCVCSVTLGYVIPFVISLNNPTYSRKDRGVNLVVVCFGIVGGTIGLVTLFL